MKRPELTWKAIRNLEALWDMADGEIANYESGSIGSLPGETKPAREAIEWIKRLRQWKTEQDRSRKGGAK